MLPRLMPILFLAAALVAKTSIAFNDAESNGVTAWWRFEEVDSDTVTLHERTGEEKEGDNGQDEDEKVSKDDPGKVNQHAEDDDDDWVTETVYSIRDDASDAKDALAGFHKLVRGVSGRALRLGGTGAHIVRAPDAAPPFVGPFSIEAWVAIGAYPVHWCPIVAQADDKRGLFFGIDAYGHLAMKLVIGGKWVKVVSRERMGLGEWSHVACSYRPDGEMEIYMDGKQVGKHKIAGNVELATGEPLLIGKEPVKRKPLGTIRAHATKDVHTFFDGILDELKVCDRALQPCAVARAHEKQLPSNPPELPERRLPAGPAGPGDFGAFYTTLKYYDAWDQQWRVGPHADVVVRFDRNPCRFVFWRGTSYIPHWVTENGVWYNNEFNETWSEHGCHEPMSDKQCRHANVRVIENSSTRVVVHWRYALVDNWYEFARVDKLTGWGDWTDEVYTIYPDGVGVREITLHSTAPEAPHEWHEGIIVMGPGQRPEDVLRPDALTMMNAKGEARTYSWLRGAPDSPGKPADANIQVVNTKSEYKPFLVVPAASNPTFDIYDDELRRDVSMFPWWNHWPTAFDPCDGRYAMDADRASHSSLTHCHWGAHSRTDDSMTKIMLNGLTNKSPEAIVRLAKSWDASPRVNIDGNEFAGGGYDPAQRAYTIHRSTDDENARLSFRVDASDASPLVNMALVIEGWGAREAEVTVDDKPANYRTTNRVDLERGDLVAWIEIETTSPVTMVVAPRPSPEMNRAARHHGP